MTFPQAFQCYIPRDKKVFGCICITKENTVLLVKGRKTHKWSFPKGHMKHTDRTNLECALRELQEETGVILDESPITYKKYSAAGYYIFDINEEYTVYPADCLEIEDAQWVPIEEIASLNKNVDLSMFCNHIHRLNLEPVQA
jgi:8-oxo-dGTP pyrophosphatase MutT (NUDIX family)